MWGTARCPRASYGSWASGRSPSNSSSETIMASANWRRGWRHQSPMWLLETYPLNLNWSLTATTSPQSYEWEERCLLVSATKTWGGLLLNQLRQQLRNTVWPLFAKVPSTSLFHNHFTSTYIYLLATGSMSKSKANKGQINEVWGLQSLSLTYLCYSFQILQVGREMSII